MTPLYEQFIQKVLSSLNKMKWNQAILYGLEAFSTEAKRHIINQLNESSAGWKFLLDIPNNNGSALVIGDELGIKGINLSRSLKSVVLLDQNVKRLIFSENAARQFGRTNISSVTGNLDCSLPFHNDIFSNVIITPIISYLSGDIQTFLIYEVCRILKQDGSLFLIAENKFNYLRVKALLKGKKSYYLKASRSAKGYESLLKKCGFTNINRYIINPEYNMARKIIPFSGKKEYRGVRCSNWKFRAKYNRFLAPHFGFRVLRSSENKSFIDNALSHITNNIYLMDCMNLFIEKYFLTPKGNCIIIFSDRDSFNIGFIMKIPITPLAEKHDSSNYKTLRNIHEDNSISQEIKSMIPKPIYLGNHNGQMFFVEGKKLSKSFGAITNNSNVVEHIIEHATTFITKLHKQTVRNTIFTEDKFDNMIGTKLEQLKAFCGPHLKIRLEKTKAYLADGLIGEVIPLVRGHGDYSVANIIVDEPSFTINGIIDWDLSEEKYLPLVDVLNLIESKYNVFQGRELGSTVCDVFLADQLSNHSRYLIAYYLQELGLSQNLVKYFVIVYWLHHVHSQLQYPFIEIDKDWIDMNIIHVLDHLEQAL